jgi:hypothetical protein
MDSTLLNFAVTIKEYLAAVRSARKRPA